MTTHRDNLVSRHRNKYAGEKHQTPNTKHQRSSKLQTPTHSANRRLACLVFGVWCFSGVWCLVFGASDNTGFGPPISVPRDLPKPKSTKSHNWIDQTRD